MILFVGFLLMEIVMPQISRTALVPYSAEQMYQLVNDVQSYPQFFTVVHWKPDSRSPPRADDRCGRCV